MTVDKRFEVVMNILDKNDMENSCMYHDFFDALNDEELQDSEKVKCIIKKIKDYENCMEKNEQKYPENIMYDVRQNLGLDKYDTRKDGIINKMEPYQILDKVCTWNGLIGFGRKIINWMQDIYGIEL